jgi:hypothetical protein
MKLVAWIIISVVVTVALATLLCGSHSMNAGTVAPRTYNFPP